MPFLIIFRCFIPFSYCILIECYMCNLIEVKFTGLIFEWWDLFLAIISAVLFLLIVLCNGIQCKEITLASLCREEIILWHSIVLQLLGQDMAWMAALEPERITIFLNILPRINKFFNAIWNWLKDSQKIWI